MTPPSPSAPVDSNDENDVHMNTSAVPNLVKPNAENNVLIDISQELCQEKDGEKGGGKHCSSNQKSKKNDKYGEISEHSLRSTKAPDAPSSQST